MFTSNQVAEFYCLNPAAPQFIYLVDFQSIKFQLVSLALSYSNLKREIFIREPAILPKFKSIVLSQSIVNSWSSHPLSL